MRHPVGFKEVRTVKVVRRTYEISIWASRNVDVLIKDLQRVPTGANVVEIYEAKDGSTAIVFEKEDESEDG